MLLIIYINCFIYFTCSPRQLLFTHSSLSKTKGWQHCSTAIPPTPDIMGQHNKAGALFLEQPSYRIPIGNRQQHVIQGSSYQYERDERMQSCFPPGLQSIFPDTQQVQMGSRTPAECGFSSAFSRL